MTAGQRALRLGLVVLVASFLGYGVLFPEGARPDILQAFKWAAFTAVVVQAPVIGKVAQSGGEQVLGCLMGGAAGYLTFVIGSLFWSRVSVGIVLSIGAATVCSSSILIGRSLHAENSAKLMAITYLLVVFLAADMESSQGALFLALTRISGILLGVLLSEVAAVLLFPASATALALRQMRSALYTLAELNRQTWEHAHQAPVEEASGSFHSRDEKADADGYQPLLDEPSQGAWAVEVKQQQRTDAQKSERLLMETYGALYLLQDSLPSSQSEVYMGKLRGRLMFIPGLPWVKLPGWGLPLVEVQALATAIRRAARLLWSLHLCFAEGFDTAMKEMLDQQYPPGLLDQLQEASQGAFDDAAAAFPNQAKPPSRNLRHFIAGVEALLACSDFQRRRVLQASKQAVQAPHTGSAQLSVPQSPTGKRTWSETLSRRSAELRRGAASGMDAAVGRSPHAEAFQKPEPSLPASHAGRPALWPGAASPAPEESGHQELMRSYLNKASLRRNTVRQPAGQTAEPEASPLSPRAPSTAAASTADWRHPLSQSRTTTVTQEPSDIELDVEAGLPRQDSNTSSRLDGEDGPEPEGHHTSEASLSWLLGHPASALGRVLWGGQRPGSAHSSLQDGSGHGRRSTSDGRLYPFSSGELPEGLGHGTTLGQQYRGSPKDIFAQLPRELRITVKDPLEGRVDSAQPAAEPQPDTAHSLDGSLLDPLDLHLQPMEAIDTLILFPETAAGYITQVRWHSFQFLCEELAEEMEELHAILGELLSKLPQPFVLSQQQAP